MNPPMRCCTKCHRKFPATLEYFHPHNNKIGLRPDCKVCRNAGSRSRYVNNDYHKNRVKRWRQEHPLTGRVYTARCRARYIQKHGHARPSLPSNPEATRKWRKAHPFAAHASSHDHHVRRRGVVVKKTPADIEAIYKRQKGRCYWCGCKVGKTYHIDHVTPVSRSGTDDPSNLVVTCPKCNLSKGNKLPHEWKGNHGKMF